MPEPVKSASLSVFGSEKRRSERVMIVMRVTLISSRSDGVRVREEVESEVVSAHGALMRSKRSVPVGGHVTLFNPRNNMKVDARVINVGQSSPDGYIRFSIELKTPCLNFWGIAFPPPGTQPLRRTVLLKQPGPGRPDGKTPGKDERKSPQPV